MSATLSGRFALAENHFREALPQRAMVIHLANPKSSKAMLSRSAAFPEKSAELHQFQDFQKILLIHVLRRRKFIITRACGLSLTCCNTAARLILSARKSWLIRKNKSSP
jgi:hypothetical protein